MQTQPLHVIGLMSGTSVDSIDAASIRVSFDVNPLRLAEFKVLGTETFDIPGPMREALLALMSKPMVALADVCRLNAEVGAMFGQAALKLMLKLEQQGIRTDLIASHGQTIYHIPPSATHLGSTLQIGHPAMIAEMTGLEVVADFRPTDMAAGGHGAPLVPFADLMLFQDEHHPRALQNIGGIANLTALPALADGGHMPLAFDTGPGNMLMDAFMEILYQQPYDADGLVAQSGEVHGPMLQALLADEYYAQRPPKSTGRERFGRAYAEQVLQQWRASVSPESLVSTATQLTVETVAQAYERFILPQMPVKEVFVAGGGALNPTLMSRLQQRLESPGIVVKTLEAVGLDSKYKEAIAFAMLGYARKMGLPNTVPSCTGARHPVCGGGIWRPFHAE